MIERQRAARPRAFILTGFLPVICRDSIYIDDLRRRDLKVLVLTPAVSRSYAEAHGDPAHPASAIDEIAFVDGSVGSEGSFLPGVIEHAERWRKWDSCFTMDFSYISGGSIRSSTKSRYRQWMTHKLGTWIDQFGTSGCVGCGRCITWCPVGIDITEEVRAIRESDNAPATKAKEQ